MKIFKIILQIAVAMLLLFWISSPLIMDAPEGAMLGSLYGTAIMALFLICVGLFFMCIACTIAVGAFIFGWIFNIEST